MASIREDLADQHLKGTLIARFHSVPNTSTVIPEVNVEVECKGFA